MLHLRTANDLFDMKCDNKWCLLLHSDLRLRIGIHVNRFSRQMMRCLEVFHSEKKRKKKNTYIYIYRTTFKQS